MDRHSLAYGYALLSVLLWSTAASAFKLSLRHMSHLELQVFAVGVAASCLFLILAAQHKLGQLRLLSWKQWLTSCVVGLLNPFLYYLVLLKAYSILPAQEALVLNYTWPITLVLLSIPLLGQRIGLRSFVALGISFVGVMIIATRGNLGSLTLSDPLGVGLAAGSSVIWALFWLLNVRDKRDEVVKLFLNFLFGFLFALFALVIFSEPRVPPLKGILGAIYVGLWEMGITFVLWLKALSLATTTAQVSNLIFLSPFLSLFFIRIFVGEQITASTMLGLFCIISGILLQRHLSKQPS